MKPQDNNKNNIEHLKLGQIGEDLVTEFLSMTQHEILERNWRTGKAEIDIIAKTTDQLLLFVEVKTRSSDFFGPGSLAINKKKKQLLLDAAVVFANMNNHQGDIRFDVANVTINEKEEVILEYLPDAFFDAF